MNYKLLNNITGWVVFFTAACVYLLTIEPTTSFWDCGEFIASAYKLEVGHPPGAPLFMMLGRFFSLFAGGDATQVARMINSLSALVSAFTILFLFWSITYFARKIIAPSGGMDNSKMIAILGSGIVGALAYTFSDTFWFSAVEGEVYATSSFFTAVVFWCILKWEEQSNEKFANRWIILISFLVGLSIGVHLLNLLAIPAIVFIFSFKKYKITPKMVIATAVLSVFLVGFTMYGIIQGLPVVISKFELIFVNGFGLPYNSGIIFFALLLIAGIIWGIRYSIQKQKEWLNTVILAFAVIIIGYSSFMTIIIRSNANTPMDQNDPEDVFLLLSYLNREQYGDRPLMTGPYYNAPVIDVEKDAPVYIKKDGKYFVGDYKSKYVYDQDFVTFFPRMYSTKPGHAGAYNSWGRIKGRTIVKNINGENKSLIRPTFGENLRFFFHYQVGFMYFRYFMWNFAGRQNDIQGDGNNIHGNWISGIKFLDESRIGPQDYLPASMKNAKSRNVYYCLPLLLGLIGLFYQHRKDRKNFWVVLLLFFFTGIAIVMYLNQDPYQPRERDYAYAASFYAFTIWIGLGVSALYHAASKKISTVISSIGVTVLCFFLVPVVMGSQNWDDHDRSNRYITRDVAHNYLQSCAPNAILFTVGDNDTFPLWYAQEVEEIRTDIRVACFPYLSTDWYIKQMQRKVYHSDPIRFTIPAEKYELSKRDAVYLIDKINEYIPLKQVMEFVASDDPKTKIQQQAGEEVSYIPTIRFRIPVDSAKVIANGTVRPEDADKIVKYIDFEINRKYIFKNTLAILDMLSANDWERPIYFTSIHDVKDLGLEEYLQLDGFTYRLVPIKSSTKGGEFGRINTDFMFDNVINKFRWGRMNQPDVLIDENNNRTAKVLNIRTNFARLAFDLMEKNKKDSAMKVLDKCMEIMPHSNYPYDLYMIYIVRGYYMLKAFDKANAITKTLSENALDEMRYYISLEEKYSSGLQNEQEQAAYIIQSLVQMTKSYNQEKISKEIEDKFNNIVALMANKKRK